MRGFGDLGCKWETRGCSLVSPYIRRALHCIGDVLGSSNPESCIGPKQRCLGVSELTCHLEKQG